MRYFSWDNNKARANVRNHGISFELAKEAFKDPYLVRDYDWFVDGETRWHSIGMVKGRLLVLIVHTIHEDNGDEYIRIYRPEKLKSGKRKSTTRPTEDWVTFEFDPNAPQTFTPEQEAEIEALARMPDSEIDFSDIPPLEERERGRKHKITIGNPWITPPTKSILDGFLVDSDIIHWVLNQVGGDGYMDKMNAMLRRAMEEERAEQRRAAAP